MFVLKVYVECYFFSILYLDKYEGLGFIEFVINF